MNARPKPARRPRLVPDPDSAPPSSEQRVDGVGPPIRVLRQAVKIADFVTQLNAHPQLWDRNVFRTAGAYGNPHTKLSDIIVRFRDWGAWSGDRTKFAGEPHESVWWRAYDYLPAIKPLIFDLMRLFEAEQLGMVLITRIPPHTNCERHADGGWHANYYSKFAVQLKAAKGQRFCFDDYSVETKTGDLFVFNNSVPHWVENPTDEERWTLIMCLRVKQPTIVNCDWNGE